MSADLEETLAELGPDYRKVVDRLRAPFAGDEGDFKSQRPKIFRKHPRHGGHVLLIERAAGLIDVSFE